MSEIGHYMESVSRLRTDLAASQQRVADTDDLYHAAEDQLRQLTEERDQLAEQVKTLREALNVIAKGSAPNAGGNETDNLFWTHKTAKQALAAKGERK